MPAYGNPRASGSSNYGSAPYEESAFKRALRMAALGGFSAIGAGLGAVRPGSNFADAFLQSAGRSSIAAQQASQAAQDYALRQEEAKRRRETDLIDTQYKEALIKNLSTEKPPPERKPDVFNMSDEEYDRYLERERRRLDIEESIKAQYKPKEVGEAEPSMSDEALRTAARVYLKTGQLPSMGMGKSGVRNRTRILNMASEMSPGAQVADNTAAYRAGQRALTDLNLQKNRLQSFENTAAQNTAIIWDFIDKVPDTGTRFGNKWSRWLANQSGNPDVASFMAAVNVVMNEYARIVTQFGGTNVMTDTARKEMERIISGDYTKKQLISVMKTIQRDAANRLISTDQQIKQIQGDIGGIGAPADASDDDPLGIK